MLGPEQCHERSEEGDRCLLFIGHEKPHVAQYGTGYTIRWVGDVDA